MSRLTAVRRLTGPGDLHCVQILYVSIPRGASVLLNRFNIIRLPKGQTNRCILLSRDQRYETVTSFSSAEPIQLYHLAAKFPASRKSRKLTHTTDGRRTVMLNAPSPSPGWVKVHPHPHLDG